MLFGPNQNFFNPYAPPMAQYPPQMPQPMQPAPANNTSPMIWVNGEQEAMAYPIEPNSAVVLWDKTAPAVYLKQADPMGRPGMTIFDIKERNATPPVEYVTRAELEKALANLKAPAGKKKEVSDNE